MAPRCAAFTRSNRIPRPNPIVRHHHPHRHLSLAVLLSLGLATGTAHAEGPFIGQFELKDLEAGHGYLQFQSQNAYAWGHPRRRVAAGDDETLFDENAVTRLRNALEMEVGLSNYLKFRIGIEFEEERLDDPPSIAQANDFTSWQLSEIGGEVIVVLIPREGDGFGLGIVTEAEHPLESGEANALIMGPIFEFAAGPWSASAIPMGVTFFGGEREDNEPRDNKWDFAYAAQVTYTFSPAWALAVEAYGTVDRIGSTGHRSEENEAFGNSDQHRIGPVVYYTYALPGSTVRSKLETADADDDDDEGPTATLGVGFFAGLTEHTPDGTLKASLEIDF